MISRAFFLLVALPVPAFAADVPRCEKLKAESVELQSFPAVACDESRATKETYVKAFPEVLELCRKLETQVNAGPPVLKLGTESEMNGQVMDLRQQHITERRELGERVTQSLLPTAVDNVPGSLPPQVSSECGTEIETFVRFRRSVLRGIQEFYGKLDQYDETLFQQVAERALPPARAPSSALEKTDRKVR